MRKIYLGFCFLIAVLMFCSCNYLETISNDQSELQSDLFSSSEDGALTMLMLTTEQDEYSIDIKRITYTIENLSQEEAYYPAYWFTIEKLINSKWKSVPFKEDIEFLDLAREISPKAKIQSEIDLEKYFNLPLAPGDYRICIQELKSNKFIIR